MYNKMADAWNIVMIFLFWSSHGTAIYKILESFVTAGLTLLTIVSYRLSS